MKKNTAKRNTGLMFLNKEYDIKHCIYCGDTFKNFDEVLKHVGLKHKVQDVHDAYLPPEGGTIYDDK